MQSAICLSIWLLETKLSELLINGLPKINNDLSKVSRYVAFFGEKLANEIQRKSELEPPTLDGSKEGV